MSTAAPRAERFKKPLRVTLERMMQLSDKIHSESFRRLYCARAEEEDGANLLPGQMPSSEDG